jgi:hypothetical protein
VLEQVVALGAAQLGLHTLLQKQIARLTQTHTNQHPHKQNTTT